MIIEAENQFSFGWGEAVMVAPGSGISVVGSLGYDLNTDFGTGHQARKASTPGLGEGLMVHVEVVTSFVENSGFPVAQFHAVLSNNILPALNPISIGCSAATRHLIGARHHWGYRVGELVQGNQFFISLNPWTTPMGKDLTYTDIDQKDLRYLGLCITQPNFDVAGTFYTAGAIRGRLVKQGDIFQNPAEFHMPSGTAAK